MFHPGRSKFVASKPAQNLSIYPSKPTAPEASEAPNDEFLLLSEQLGFAIRIVPGMAQEAPRRQWENHQLCEVLEAMACGHPMNHGITHM